MLEMLPPELAQLVVYGLTFASHLPTHRFTESHAEELRRAVAIEGEPVAADIWERPSCIPAMRGDEAEGGAAAGEGAGSVVEAQAPAVPDPDVLSLRTTALREEAAELVDKLEAFAAAVREGRQPDGHEALLSAVTSWMRERQFLAEAFAEAVSAAAEDAEPSDPWGPDAGWLEAAALTERLREEERERGRIAQEIAKVVQARDEAVGLIEQAVSDLMRQALVDQVAQFDRKLRKLRGDPVADTTSSEAESDSATDASADRVSPGEGSGETDPGPGPGPAPKDKTLGPEGEAIPPGADYEVRGQGDTPASQDGGAGDSFSSGNTPEPVAAATTEAAIPGPEAEAVDRPDEMAAQDTGAAQVRVEPASPGSGEHHDDEGRTGGDPREAPAPTTPGPRRRPAPSPAPTKRPPPRPTAGPEPKPPWRPWSPRVGSPRRTG
ncbi:hypothetical protein [Streptomyces sp. JNUCC 63]